MLAVVDIGGTKIRIGLYDRKTKIVNDIKDIRTPRDMPLWRAVIENVPRDVEAITIATMGPLKIREGKIVNNPHLPSKEQELARPIIEKLRVPVYVANDAVAGAWAEYKSLNCENLVYVAFGTGVGVGVVVDGNLLIGKDGNAHEFGHVTVDMDSELECGCGGKGHVEAFLGGSNIPKFSKAIGLEVKDASEFFQKLRHQDRLLKAFERVLLTFLSSVSNAYDPECLVFGGGVFNKNIDIFMDIASKLNSWEGLVVEPPRVLASRYGDLAPLYGAAMLALDKPDTWFRKLEYLRKHITSH